jgi:hypothetical protein
MKYTVKQMLNDFTSLFLESIVFAIHPPPVIASSERDIYEGIKVSI